MLTEFADVILHGEQNELSHGERVEKPIRVKHLIKFGDRIKTLENSLTNKTELDAFKNNCSFRGNAIEYICRLSRFYQFNELQCTRQKGYNMTWITPTHMPTTKAKRIIFVNKILKTTHFDRYLLIFVLRNFHDIFYLSYLSV